MRPDPTKSASPPAPKCLAERFRIGFGHGQRPRSGLHVRAAGEPVERRLRISENQSHRLRFERDDDRVQRWFISKLLPGPRKNESACVEVEGGVGHFHCVHPAGSEVNGRGTGKDGARTLGTGLRRVIEIERQGEADLRILDRPIGLHKTTQDPKPDIAIRSGSGKFGGSNPHGPCEEFAPLRAGRIGFRGDQKEGQTSVRPGNLEVRNWLVRIDPKLEPAIIDERSGSFCRCAATRPRWRRGKIVMGVDRDGTCKRFPRRHRAGAQFKRRLCHRQLRP